MEDLDFETERENAEIDVIPITAEKKQQLREDFQKNEQAYDYLFLNKDTQDEIKDRIKSKAREINLTENDPIVLSSELNKYFLIMQRNIFQSFIEVLKEENANYFEEIHSLENEIYRLAVKINKLEKGLNDTLNNLNK